MNYDKEKFLNILDKLKTLFGSQNKMAEALELSSSYITKIYDDNTKNPPAPEYLKKIAKNSKGITTYEELMSICGYIGNFSSAVYNFATDNDKKIINEAFNYWIKNKINFYKIDTNPEILNILSRLENTSLAQALQQLKTEAEKAYILYGIDLKNENFFEIRAIARDVSKLKPEKKELFLNLLKQMSDEADEENKK